MQSTAVSSYHVVRRNGTVVEFDSEKISLALSKAFLAVEGGQAAMSSRVRELISNLTRTVTASLTRRLDLGGSVHIEDIQDHVELALMRSGQHDVARAYVLYREKRAAEREPNAATTSTASLIHVVDGDQRFPLDTGALLATCTSACEGLCAAVSPIAIVDLALNNLYDGVSIGNVRAALVLAARTLIEREPDYNKVTARLLLLNLAREVLQCDLGFKDLAPLTAAYFPNFIKQLWENHFLDFKLNFIFLKCF